jgi:hypothetical protein
MKTTLRTGAAALALAAGLGCAAPALAQADPFVGQLALFGMNWCPKNWLPANGQTISIQQNAALYSLFGIQYGGNGVQTFGLPNLQARAPVSASATYPVGTSWGQAQPPGGGGADRADHRQSGGRLAGHLPDRHGDLRRAELDARRPDEPPGRLHGGGEPVLLDPESGAVHDLVRVDDRRLPEPALRRIAP